jgi:glycosyltransferase involved in cell wall biosynthesis
MVTPSYYPITGGAEEVVKNLSIELNKIGVETDVMTFNMRHKWNPAWRKKTEEADGLRVFRIPALNWFPTVHSDRFTFRINLIPGRFRNRFRRYDIIHFHDGGDLSFPVFSSFVRQPKILHLHGFHSDFYARYFLNKYVIKRMADLYITISRKIAKELSELDIPEYKIRYLPNGIDMTVFHPSNHKEDNLVLFVGRIDPIKGLHILLEASRHLQKPIHLVVIGPASWNSAYFRTAFETIHRLNRETQHTVEYLGELKREKIVEWYQRASVLVRCDVDGISGGLTSLEAFACATPVIGTGNGIIKCGVNGIVLPPNNVVELAKGIQYLLDNKDIRRDLGNEGRKMVAENFSNLAITQRLCHIYRELV